MMLELFKPTALAAPNPVEGLGLLSPPNERLSNVHAVSVAAAFAPDSEASSSDMMQTMFFIFIILSGVVVFLLNQIGSHFCAEGIIHFYVTNKWRTFDNLVTSFFMSLNCNNFAI
jgi:hypothetical protein